MAQPERSRNWCFTWNNYEREDLDYLRQNVVDANTTYCIWGEEVGAQGTRHLQGTILFKNARAFGGVTKLLLKRAHIEVCMNVEKSIEYCKKEGKYEEFGKPPVPRPENEQGRRTDLESIRDMILEEKIRNEVDLCMMARSYMSIRAGKELLKYLKKGKINLNKKIIWLWGSTGVGKTKLAIELCGGIDNCWISSKDLKWWEGYSGEKNVIFDDFRGDFCKFHELLRILDIYPYRAEVKGSSCIIDADLIVITSPFPPNEVYAGRTDEDIMQLLRRITEVRKMHTAQ